MTLFPDDSAARKKYPIYGGLLAYFPSALAAVARHSFVSNEQHNPGEPLYWNRAKSGDEADALLRHLMEGDYVGVAWRALALLQKHLESEGAPIAPGARVAHPGSLDALRTERSEHHAIEAPMPPVLEIEDDDEPGSLKAGEAYRNPVSQEDEE